MRVYFANHGSIVAFSSRTLELFVLAKLSYTLYLVHITVIPLAVYVTSAVPGFEELPAGGQFILFVPAYIGFSLLGSLLLHYVFEKPFLLLKDRPSKQQESPKQTAQATA